MPRHEAAPWPAAPRVAEALGTTTAPFGDGVSWSGVDVGPQGSFTGSASEYEVLGSHLKGVRLTAAVLEGGHWTDVVVEDCEFSGAALEDAALTRVVFDGCRMSGLVAIGLNGHDVRFANCKLDGANFRGSALERCAFEDCDLGGADFYGARLAPAAVRRCSLVEAEFSKAKCEGLDLRGSDLGAIRGAASFKGCLITPDQMVPLGLALLATIDVHVTDEGPPAPSPRARTGPYGTVATST
jgi:uncharacterized protein YjbI with pentapeptide repeats